jgi:hypothetical protein
MVVTIAASPDPNDRQSLPNRMDCFQVHANIAQNTEIHVWSAVSALSGWASVVVAAVALGAAIIAARATVQTNRAQQEALRLQQGQVEAAEHRALREQASQIVFYYLGPGDYSEGDDIQLQNASNLPIYDLRIIASLDDDRRARAWEQVLTPTGSESTTMYLHNPDQRRYPSYSDVQLHFKDAAGEAWVRSAGGKLRRATQSDHDELQQLMQQLPPSQAELHR